MRVFLFIIFFFFSSNIFFGKNNSVQKYQDDKFKTSNKSSIVDSLKIRTYQELENLFYENKNDSILAKIYVENYLNRAKETQDTLRIANAYYLYCNFNIDKPGIIIQYADSIINITQNSMYKKYPTRGYLFKGYALFLSNQYEKALDPYLQGIHHARLKDDPENFIVLKHNIALLKDLLGNDDEALQEYRENLKFIKRQDTVTKFQTHYIATLAKISEIYNNFELLDSASHYIEKGIRMSVSRKDKRYYPNLLRSYGINSYKRKKYSIAIDSLKKVLTISKDKTIAYSYLAKSLLKLKKQDEALIYFKKFDSITSINNYLPETRDVITWMINYYRSIDDKKNQLRLMKKLIQLDSITNKRHYKLSVDLVKNYDTAKLIQEKDELIQEIKNKNTQKYLYTIIPGITLIIVIVVFYLNYYKRKKLKYIEEYEKKLLDFQQKNNSKRNKTKDLEISTELTNEVLEKLKQFEDGQEFLKNNITLVKVAKKFKTNSTYLSKIINTHKQKNFANYLNDLRIEYCIEKLKNDRKFRRYSILSIAKEVGFNNIQSFSAAFYKCTEKHPSLYIKSLIINDLK